MNSLILKPGSTSHSAYNLRDTHDEAEERHTLGVLVANEPGVLAYVAHFTETDPKEVVFFEVYKDEAAVAAHGTTPHMNAMRAKFMQVFKPPLKLEKLTKVAGVTR